MPPYAGRSDAAELRSGWVVLQGGGTVLRDAAMVLRGLLARLQDEGVGQPGVGADPQGEEVQSLDAAGVFRGEGRRDAGVVPLDAGLRGVAEGLDVGLRGAGLLDVDLRGFEHPLDGACSQVGSQLVHFVLNAVNIKVGINNLPYEMNMK